MKKVTLPMLLMAALTLGCQQKQEVVRTEVPANHEKTTSASAGLSDADLINRIRNVQDNEQKKEELMEILLDNTALSRPVLKEVVDNPRLNNNFAELCFIASAPVATAEVDYLKLKRPGINTANIEQANMSLTPGQTFTILGAPLMKVVFAPDLERRVLDDCTAGECSSQLYSPSGMLTQIGWGSNDGTVFAKNCNPDKWVCGTLVRQTLCGADGITVCILKVCENSSDKCERILKRPHESVR